MQYYCDENIGNHRHYGHRLGRLSAEGPRIVTLCPLPWLSMIINVDGEVTPCCYWRSYASGAKGVGNINEGGILAAWNGPEFVAIRQQLRDGGKGLPCENCMAMRSGGSSDRFYDLYYGQVSEAADETAAHGNLVENLAEFQGGVDHLHSVPTVVTLVSTTACNIDCTFCNQTPQRVARQRLDDRFVNELLELAPRLTHLAWQGGEALVDKRYLAFLRTFDKGLNPHLQMHLVTNGLLATPAVIDTYVDKVKHANIVFSMDSFDKTNYERLRRGASYDVVMANLKYALSVARNDSRLTVTAQGCLMKSTIGEVRENLAAARDLGVLLLLSPVLAWPPQEALNCFSDYAAETRGWKESLASARRFIDEQNKDAVAVALDAGAVLATVSDMLTELDAIHAQTVPLRVVVSPLPVGALARRWPVMEWSPQDGGGYRAVVALDVPTYNLVNVEMVLVKDGADLDVASPQPEGRYRLTGGVAGGRYYAAIHLAAVPGHDPRQNGFSLAIRLRPLKEVTRRRHGDPILAIFPNVDCLPPAVAHFPIGAPGEYFINVPMVYARATLGCMIIEDEVAYYASSMSAAAIETAADGRPVINICVLP